MADSGSGTGTPITPAPPEGKKSIFGAIYPNSAIPLARYAQLIGYRDCAFFGVAKSTNNNYACRKIWMQDQRDDVAMYLAEAQDELELELEYPLTVQWFTDEEHAYDYPLLTKKGFILGGGVRSIAALQEDAAVNHAADPATVSIAGVSITEITGVKIYYPDTDQEITPSNITLSGGTLGIEIPRCRLVAYDKLDNAPEGLDYANDSLFQTTVDVLYISNDPATHASIIWPHGCSAGCSSTGCSDFRRDGCIYVRQTDIGSIDILPANYSGGTWTRTNIRNCCGLKSSRVVVNYYAGLSTLPRMMETAMIRLAHSRMPWTPCGCDQVMKLWERDTHVPDILTKERLECPFGLSAGAWAAWKFAQKNKLMRAGTEVVASVL